MDLPKLLVCFALYFVKFGQYAGKALNFKIVDQAMAKILSSDEEDVIGDDYADYKRMILAQVIQLLLKILTVLPASGRGRDGGNDGT